MNLIISIFVHNCMHVCGGLFKQRRCNNCLIIIIISCLPWTCKCLLKKIGTTSFAWSQNHFIIELLKITCYKYVSIKLILCNYEMTLINIGEEDENIFFYKKTQTLCVVDVYCVANGIFIEHDRFYVDFGINLVSRWEFSHYWQWIISILL